MIFPLPYITSALRFPSDDALCEGSTTRQIGRWACAGDEGKPLPAIHTFEGRNHCAYHSPFDNKYTPCTRCGTKPAFRDDSIEVDPICADCNQEMLRAEVGEPTESICRDCSKQVTRVTKGEGLCADCEETALDEGRYCPGWGDSCGNLCTLDSDLCPDCTMARMDAQSPRIPQ